MENLRQLSAQMKKRFNRYTRNICPLQNGDIAAIQNQFNRRQWNTMGKVITVLSEHQYRIRIDGSSKVTLRKLRFMKKLEVRLRPISMSCAMLEPTSPAFNISLTHPNPSVSSSDDAHPVSFSHLTGITLKSCPFLIESCQHAGEREGADVGVIPSFSINIRGSRVKTLLTATDCYSLGKS